MEGIVIQPTGEVEMALLSPGEFQRPELGVSQLPQHLTPLADIALQPSIDQAVEAVREFLGMDIAYATEIVGGDHHLRVLQGDGESFHARVGLSLPAEQTYCDRVLGGRLPNVIPDVQGEAPRRRPADHEGNGHRCVYVGPADFLGRARIRNFVHGQP
jgi:catechol 2,3-dioxygenase-like lactoylglutathione lyase family enzyme